MRMPVAWVLIAATLGCGRKSTNVEGFPPAFAGVGIELAIEGGRPVVKKPIPGGPGDIAGVKVGDRLTAIDGAPTEGQTLGDVVVRLRGRPDSQVTVEIDRKGTRVLVVMKRQKMQKVGDAYRAER